MVVCLVMVAEMDGRIWQLPRMCVEMNWGFLWGEGQRKALASRNLKIEMDDKDFSLFESETETVSLGKCRHAWLELDCRMAFFACASFCFFLIGLC